MSWRTQSACVGNTHLFFSDELDEQIAAKQICKVCNVRVECLEAGLVQTNNSDESGIWGGLTPKERRAIVRRRRAR